MNSELCSSLYFLLLLLAFQVLGEEVEENPICSKGKNCCQNSNQEDRCPENSNCNDNQDGCDQQEIQPLEKPPEFKALSLQESKHDFRLKTKTGEMGDKEHLKKSSSMKKSWNNVFKSHFCPGRKQRCPNSFTCCLMTNGRYGCCPYPGAICCSDQIHCCPKGSKCSVKTKACVPI